MTKYICHGCGKIYDDVGMPGKCCDKTLRHIYDEAEALIGKEFLKIEDSEIGNIKITFKDGTIAYFDCCSYPDGSVREISLDEIKVGDNKE